MKSNEIKVYGADKELLSVSLEDVLKCIVDGNECKWSILWLEAIGRPDGKTMLELEKEVNSEKGLFLDWHDLQDLSQRLDQVIEFLLIGDKDASKLKRYGSDEEMYSTCWYTIELFDSSYWNIHAKNVASVRKIKERLIGVEES